MKKVLLTCAFALSIVLNDYGQCGPVFQDGFESGTYTPTWSMGPGLTSAAVTNTNPAMGTYRLEANGGTSTHLTGLSTIIPSATPTQISWWIYPTGSGASNYVVLGNSSVSATNCISFCYWQGGTNIRFVSGSTAVYNCSPDQWYHIEMRNINFTTHVFDIYIDNNLVQANFPFRSSSQNDLTNIHLYNFNTSIGVWDDLIIGDAPPISLSNTSTNVLCNGSSDGSIDLTATSLNPGTITYAWNNANTSEDLTGLSAGSYSVVVTDGLGCQDSINNINITEPTSINTSISSTALNCNGDNDATASIMATGGTPGYTYSWSNGEITINASNLSGNLYYCTVTDTNGCSHIDSVAITEPSAISASFNMVEPSCNGSNNGAVSILSNGGTPGYSYSWSTLETTSTISNLISGWYYCTTMDTLSCSHLDSILVTEPTPISISLLSSNPTTCNGNEGSINATISGGTPGYTYLWNDGTTTEDDFSLISSIYYVTVTDANGCTNTSSTTLTDPTTTNVSLSIPEDSVCLTNGTFTLTGASVLGGTYSGNGVSGGMFTPSTAGIGAQTITYNYVDANNCASSAQDVIDVNACLGFENENLDQLIHIYPNPATTLVYIDLGVDEKNLAITILNDLGQVMDNLQINTQNYILNVERYPAGIYYIRVNNEQKKMVKKIIIQ